MTIEELKSKIDATINGNGKRLITGAQLNEVLNAIATYTAEVEGVSLKVPQFLPFDSIIANADVQVGSTSAIDYEIVYVESKNVFTAYTGGVYYTDWVGSSSYNKGTFSKSAIATNLYINPYAEIYKIENSKLVAIQKYDIANVVATYGDRLATLSYKGATIYPETKGSQVKLSIGGNADDAIKQNSSNIVKEKERAQQVEMYLESQKANKYGYYEGLSVGVSDNLSGRGEATESEFSFRPSGGENKSIPEDGTARINSIKGNSVVWNQLSAISSVKFTIKNDTDKEVGSWLRGIQSLNGCEGHKLYVVATNDSDVYCYINLLNTYNINTGAICKYNNPNNNTPRLYCIIPPNTNKEITVTLKITDLTKMFNGVNEPATVEEFESLYGNMPNEYNEGTIIDNHTSAIKSVGVNMLDVNSEILTPPMYSTPEEPKNWAEVGKLYKGVSFKGYCRSIDLGDFVVKENEIYLSNSGADYFSGFFLKVLPNTLYDTSIGEYNGCQCIASFYDKNKKYISHYYTAVYGNPYGGRFETPSNCEYVFLVFGIVGGGTATIPYPVCHLLHDGYMTGKYTPYPYYEDFVRELPTVEGGLKSAGTAYDEIRYNKSKDKWEHIQRIGQVDLGTLSWYAATNCFGSSSIINAIQPPSSNVSKARILCAKYNATYQDAVFNGEQIGVSIGVDKNIFIRDTAYTDVATFKQAMQGVILYYELAEPVVTELDVDISPDYKVWDYGTEEAISEVLSTPVRINANYGFNAVGQITDNTELIKELLARVAVLEAQIAQANSANVEPIEPIVE